MATLRHLALVGALGVLLGAAGTPLDAQVSTAVDSPLYRASFDGMYTRLRFDTDGGSDRMIAEGLGAKLMWTPAAGNRWASGILGRTDVGLYATWAADRDFLGPKVDLRAFTLGVATDVRPFPTPLLGRVEPFLSLGAGVLHTEISRPPLTAPHPLLDRSRTAFTVTPGVGTRLRLTPRLALQGDVRDLMTFRDGTRHNVAWGAGVRLGL